ETQTAWRQREQFRHARRQGASRSTAWAATTESALREHHVGGSDAPPGATWPDEAGAVRTVLAPNGRTLGGYREIVLTARIMDEVFGTFIRPPGSRNRPRSAAHFDAIRPDLPRARRGAPH